MKRTVTVLQDDIDNGKKGSYSGCAVARAALRDLGGDSAFVNGYAIELFSRSGDRRKFRVPPEVSRFIERFDHGLLPVEPFKFEADEVAL